MNTERKMIGLPAQARSVPPVPIDYGTRGTPSLVVKTTKGTNQIKYELGRNQARFIQNQVVRKIDSKNRIGKPEIHSDSTRRTRNEFHSNLLVSKQTRMPKVGIRSQHPAFNFCPIDSVKGGCIEPHSLHPCQPKSDSDSPRWQHPPPISHRPRRDCLWKQSSNPISEIKIIKQTESHPTGFLIDKPREKVSRTYQSKPRAHLLHRTIDRYHE